MNNELDEYGGWTGIQGEKTGFFHLGKNQWTQAGL